MPTKREVIGLWPCFYATIRLLCHCLQEHIFVVLLEATTSIFFVALQGCKLLALQWRQWSYFFMSNSDIQTKLYNLFIVLQASKDTTWYCKEQASVHVVSQGRTTTNSFFRSYRERSDDRSIIYTSYHKKRWRRAYFLCHIAKRRWRWRNPTKKNLYSRIKRQEADRICKRLLREASEKLRGRLHEASNGRRSQHARRKIALCNNRCRYVVDRGDQSHRCCCIDDNCGGDKNYSKDKKSHLKV